MNYTLATSVYLRKLSESPLLPNGKRKTLHGEGTEHSSE